MRVLHCRSNHVYHIVISIHTSEQSLMYQPEYEEHCWNCTAPINI